MKGRHGPAFWLLFLTSCDGCFGDSTVADAVEAVAQCTSTRGDVRRRLSSASAWTSLRAGTDLFAGDWVQTAAEANAQVAYDDGARLFVEPGTTVVIEQPNPEDEEGMRRIAVRAGSVRTGLVADSKKAVQVRLPSGETIGLSSAQSRRADVRIEVDDAGKAEVAVTQGTVALTTSAGTTVEVESGTARRVEADRAGPPEPLPLPPDPVEPGPGPHYVSQPLGLAWSTPERKRTFEVELSSDEALLSVDQMLTTERRTVGWTPPRAGRWYWRVAAIDEKGRHSPPSRTIAVDIVVDDRLRLLRAPADEAVYRVSRGPAKVDFRWDPHPERGPYTLLVAEDSSFDTIVVQRELDEPSAFVSLAPGAYFWGVRRTPDASPLFVEPFRLTVVRKRSDLKVPAKLDWGGSQKSR